MLVRTQQQINTSFVGVTQAAISYKRLKQTILSQKYIDCWVLSVTLFVLVLNKRHRNILYQNPVALHARPVQLPLVKSPALRYLHIRSREFAATIFHVTEHLDRGKSWWVKNQFATKKTSSTDHTCWWFLSKARWKSLHTLGRTCFLGIWGANCGGGESDSLRWDFLRTALLLSRGWAKIFFRITCFHGKKNISAFPPYHSLVSGGAHYSMLQQHSET